ncbi:DDE-type integrase/transposase/recombinase [Castellaniella sp.]|uniref:DDE-type integrase/transposase/recombinase n=1 Tax=Castellaniella sp. TaxID=1955812 RepID=UPI003A933C63
MLSKEQLIEFFDRLGTPAAGRRLVIEARVHAPVREVRSTGRNVITLLASRKMQREIATESRKAEYAAAVDHEVNPQVLEYYPQPCTLALELIDPETGEVHPIDHTPDFLVIQPTQILLQEWKTEDKLMHLARRQPWRYQKHGSRWCSPQIEEQLAKMGIAYEIHSSAEIHPNRTKNWEILEDYFHVGAPSCSPQTIDRLDAALAEHGRLSLRDLQGPDFKFLADELNRAIVEGHGVCDLESALLSNPDEFILYRDDTLMAFCQAGITKATTDPNLLHPSFMLNLERGTRFRYEGQVLEVSLLAEREVVFRTPDDGGTLTLNKDWLLHALSSGKLVQIEGATQDGVDLHPLVQFSQKALETAQRRAQYLNTPYDPATAPMSRRTYYRLQAQQSEAVLNGGHEILALAPRHTDKGNRTQRLSPEQISAMEHVRRTFYTTPRAPNGKAAFRELQARCDQEAIACPSYPTFLAHLKGLEGDAERRTRYGKRLAYQKRQFYYSLAYDTPRHGVRPFECVHIDHTLLDIELKCRRTGLSLGRPWLTLMIDAYSRRVMAMHLGFQPPDRSAVFMALRAFVKRWQRLPQMLMTDNGKDLIASDIKHFLTSMGVHFRLRPAGQPRVGSVMERLFGTLNKQLVHNLEGNTELTRQVRMITGSHLPKRLANWNLENLYTVLEHWAFTFYDQQVHPALDISPREAFQRALRETGERAHRAIAFNQDFLIATCPSVDRGGERTLDRQRGVKVHNFYYQSPRFDNLLLARKKFPVRYDPYDVSRVFVLLPNQLWVEAHSMQLQHLPRLNMRQLEAVSAEYLKVHSAHHSRQDTISGTQLLEFIATMSPDAEVLRQAQKLGETEYLHEKLGLLNPGEADSRPRVFGLESMRSFALTQSSGLGLTAGNHPGPQPTRRSTPNKLGPRSTQKGDTPPEHDTFQYGDLD